MKRTARRRGTVLASVLAFAAVVAACGGGSSATEKPKATTTTAAPTTTTVAPPTAPLTGLPDPTGASHTRPVLSVKVENTPEARPQAGIEQADVLYEEVVEAGITRFVAMFNSEVPPVVGPVRSVRAEDPDIVWPLGGIFAYSGGAPVNVEAINAAPVHAVDEDAGKPSGAMVRNEPSQPPRDAPHNLYAIGQPMFDLGGDPKPPPALFQYVANGAPPVTGQGVLNFHVGFDPGYDPTWTWNGATGTWDRAMDGGPHTVVGSGHISPANVVVQFTPYTGEGEAQTVGEGDVWIFTDGTLRQGRWVRPDKAQPAKYVDVTAAPVPATTAPPAPTAKATSAKQK